MTWLPRALVAGVLLALTAACGDDGGAPVEDKEPAVIVEYAVEGGYLNQMRSVVVHEDGTLDVVRSGAGSTVHWDADQVQDLVARLDASGLFDEDHEFPPPGGADLQRYEISYAGVTVVSYDTTVPPELAGAIALLEGALTTP